MRPASLVVVLLTGALGGCGKGNTVATSPEITGTLTVDGASLTVLACRPGSAMHTFVEVLTPEGVLRFEDKQLFWNTDPRALSRGEVLTCEQLDRSWGGGVRFDGSAYWRGTLAFRCKAGTRIVSGDLKLDCGNITAAERRSLDQNRKELREQQGSAAAREPAPR